MRPGSSVISSTQEGNQGSGRLSKCQGGHHSSWVGGCWHSLWSRGQLDPCGRTLSQDRQGWSPVDGNGKGLPGAPGMTLSEVCQRDLYNVAKLRPALGTLLGRRKALVALIAVFQKCRTETQSNNGLAKIMRRTSARCWMWILLSWPPSRHLALKITTAALLSWAM